MDYGKRPPLDEQKSLWEASLAAEGVTTGAGAATGDSFIDAGLIGAGANSFISMLAVIYPGQPANVDSMDITAFNNVTGEVTLAKAYKGVAAAIPAGVPYKIVTFRFVPAEVAAIAAAVAIIDGFHDIPGVDAVANAQMRDVIGGKADTPIYSAAFNVSSIIRYLKGLMGASIPAWGTADAGSDADTLVDAARAEANDYWNGMTLLMISGANAGLARRIYDYAVGSIEVRDAFPNAIAATDVYVILSNYEALLAATDSVENFLVRDVIGSKASSAIYTKDNFSDIIRYLKGLVDSQITASGVADAGSGVGLIRDAARTEVDDWWNGQTVLMLTGAAALQKRPITDFIAATDDIIVAPNFDGAVGAGDIYVILAHYNMIVPRTADDVANELTSEVVGRKDDTATPDDMSALATSSLVRELKRVLLRMSADAFTATIQGAAQTELDTMLYQLGTYISALGAAYSAAVNPGAAAKSNIEQTLEDLGDILAGAGITTYPLAQPPGNGISIAEVIRQIYNDLVAVEAKIDAGVPKLYVEQIPDTDVDETITDTEADCVLVNLPYIATKTYCLRYLRLKCADPGVGRTVTVKLYERWNDAIAQLIDSFDIDSSNYGTYHSLMDIFSVPEIHSDAILIRAVHDGTSPGDDVAIEVTYRHAIATT